MPFDIWYVTKINRRKRKTAKSLMSLFKLQNTETEIYRKHISQKT